MTVEDVLKDIPKSAVECWQMVEVFKGSDAVVGAVFKVTDDNGNDFKFALSLSVINENKAISEVFGWEMKARICVDVDTVEENGYLWCVPIEEAVEVRESNLDYIYDSPQSKEGCVFVDGRKYNSKDVIVFNVIPRVLDALEVCTTKES